ncbi:hypothetical protein BGW38_010652 [Lunasporangiospora selenospora]|uniref:Uncharacterized protein n=1 Tax=Lunasporangiospora selenospora TaxID=979761 RepID=A0A9P6KES0_9FUNG|nr:hypothetical protein BGW38_010652 [Lunasporangiospora selenospora]
MFTRAALVVAMTLASLALGPGSVTAISEACDILKHNSYIEAQRSLMAGMDKQMFTKDGRSSESGHIYLTKAELAWGGGIGPSLCYAGSMGIYRDDPERCPTYDAPLVYGSQAWCSYKNMVVKARFKPYLLDKKSCPSAVSGTCDYSKTEIKSQKVSVGGKLEFTVPIFKALSIGGSLGASIDTEMTLETKESFSLKPGSTASLFGVTVIIETNVEEIKTASVVDTATRVCQPGAKTGNNIGNNYFLTDKTTSVWATLNCTAEDRPVEKRQDQAPPAADSFDDNACYYYDIATDAFFAEPCSPGV